MVTDEVAEEAGKDRRDIDRFSMFKDRKSTLYDENKAVVQWSAYIARLYREES